MRIKLSGCLLVALACTLHLTAQDFNGTLTAFQTRNPQEKIYLHFDKDNYVAGETIWFKAYLFHNNMPSLLSSNFFVQLTDTHGTLLQSLKYPINGAAVKGQIDLPDSLEQGAYVIHAFTATTLNFSADALAFRKGFYIYNPVKKKEAPVAPPAVSIQFFPESGQLVHGLSTLVAFKATDASGKPVETSGMIKMADGFTIPIKTNKLGMGRVVVRADANKTYTATLNNQPQVFSLPAVVKSGINLHIEDEKGGKAFTITRSAADKNNFQRLFVVAQINNQVVYEQDIDFEDYPSLKGHLLTDKLPSGILHFTVFNKDGAPLAERLAFVNNGEYRSKASLAAIKKNLQKRGENQLELTDTDSLQKSLSVSISDYTQTDANDRESIISRFLLTSDLKGYVYNPAWYFEQPADSVKTALDNLMMTHGWSRFNWKKILAGELASATTNDAYLLMLRGTVRDDKGKEVKGGELNLFIESEDSTTQSYDVDVDTRGRFLLDSMLFYGQAKFYYTYFFNGKQRPATIVLDTASSAPAIPLAFPLASPALPVKMLPLSAAEASRRYQFSKDVLGKTKQLDPVVLEAKSGKKPIDLVNEKYTSGAFRSPAKVNLDNVNQPTPNKTINPLDYAMNNIRLLEMQNGKLVNNRTMSLQSGEKWAVALFIDETPADIALLRTYRMDEIALIKYYDPGFVGAGSNGPGGALAVYTRHGKEEKAKPVSMDYVEYKGYSISREFYHPDYATSNVRHDLADLRGTLYWNPDVLLDGDRNKMLIRFFNNDFSKKLKLVVEGFSADGKLIHLETVLE